jgi:hypothetical protein
MNHVQQQYLFGSTNLLGELKLNRDHSHARAGEAGQKKLLQKTEKQSPKKEAGSNKMFVLQKY